MSFADKLLSTRVFRKLFTKSAATYEHYIVATPQEVKRVLVARLGLAARSLDNGPRVSLATKREHVKFVVFNLYIRLIAFKATEDKDSFLSYLLCHFVPLYLGQSVQLDDLSLLVCDQAHGAGV